MDTVRRIKRIAVAVIGGTVLLIGLAAIFLPLVPAFVLVPAGLAILATQFVWARRWLKKAKRMFNDASGKGEKK